MKMIAAIALVVFLGACDSSTPEAEGTADSMSVATDSTAVVTDSATSALDTVTVQ